MFLFRHLSEAVSARYLASERRGRSLKNMAEYFLGRWSGKLKPASLPGLTLLLSDRKVRTAEVSREVVTDEEQRILGKGALSCWRSNHV